MGRGWARSGEVELRGSVVEVGGGGAIVRKALTSADSNLATLAALRSARYIAFLIAESASGPVPALWLVEGWLSDEWGVCWVLVVSGGRW